MDYSSRFKECTPLETVKRIKSILKSININTTESWMSTIDGIYSVRIDIENTHIGTNGKGSAKEFALASGYGELMERLENLLPFRFTDCYSQYTKGNEYEFTPLEIYTEGLLSDKKQKTWFNKVIPTLTKSELLNLELSLKNANGKITNIPFKSVTTEDEILIPLNMLDIIYGSNGMAAGNTIEEAIVQGLSEIIERYVCKKVISDSLQVPDITKFIRSNYSNIDKMIKSFESEKFVLSIKDMSIGEDFPVIAVILFDKEKLNYLVNFGSHPSLEVSVERSITELFQGRDINNLNEMVKINSNIKGVKSNQNRYKIFADGGGSYHPRLFTNRSDETPQNTIWKQKFENNTEMMSALIKLLQNKGFNVYYLNNSFLGFPACHVLVPGMSEIAPANFKECQKFLNDNSRLQELYKKIELANNDEICELISYIDKDSTDPMLSLNDIYLLPLNYNNDLRNITKFLILMMLYCSIEDYKNAYRCSCKFINLIEKEEENIETINYYKMISAIFNCRCDSMNDEEIIFSLSNFSDVNFVSECINDLKRENIFMYLPRITCPNCEQCSISNECNFTSEKKLFDEILKHQKIFYQDSKK